jgi:F-type H+-transporting ATPase subunit a
MALLLAAGNPVDHVTDKPILGQWYVSNATVMLLLGAIVTAAIVLPAARRIATGHSGSLEDLRAKGLWANLVESVCLYLREAVFRPVLGDQTDRYTPMLWTLFWFILVSNLLGLVPLVDWTAPLLYEVNDKHGIGGTATQSIWVTGALAAIAFLFWNGVALMKDPIGYLKHLTAEAPWFMWPIMVPVEIMGMFVKPLALALRLFANITGGHIILAVLLSFITALVQNLGGWGYGLALFPLLGATAVNVLEILVAFIQAYIFTFLTCLFLGQLVVHEHDEHDEQELGEGAMRVDPHEALAKRDVRMDKRPVVEGVPA